MLFGAKRTAFVCKKFHALFMICQPIGQWQQPQYFSYIRGTADVRRSSIIQFPCQIRLHGFCGLLRFHRRTTHKGKTEYHRCCYQKRHHSSFLLLLHIHNRLQSFFQCFSVLHKSRGQSGSFPISFSNTV